MSKQLTSGIYYIMNEMWLTFAAVKNSNNSEVVVARAMPDHVSLNEDGTRGHLWQITRYTNNTYTLLNLLHNVYAHTQNERLVATSRDLEPGDDPALYWKIVDFRGSYRITPMSIESKCWQLSSDFPGAEISIAESSGATSTQWAIVAAVPVVDLLQNPLDSNGLDEDSSVIMIDHRAHYSAAEKIDLVLISTEGKYGRRASLKLVLTVAHGIQRLSTDRRLPLDMTMRAVLYTFDDSEWSLYSATINSEGRNPEDEQASEPGPYDFNAVMKEVIETQWRKGATPVIVFIPQVEPPSPQDAQNSVDVLELCRQVRAHRMIIVLDAHEKLLYEYLCHNSFFCMLEAISPHETVVSSQTMMPNWIIASTLCEHNVEVLSTMVTQSVKLFADSEMSKAREEFRARRGTLISSMTLRPGLLTQSPSPTT